MRTKIKLENEFHGTATCVIARTTNGLVGISARQARAAVGRLCGIAGCTCGGVRSNGWQLEYRPDGSAIVTYCNGVPLVIE